MSAARIEPDASTDEVPVTEDLLRRLRESGGL